MGRVKDMILFHCEQCGSAVLDDDVGFDGENCLCEPCVTKWANEEFRRVTGWQPLQTKEKANA